MDIIYPRVRSTNETEPSSIAWSGQLTGSPPFSGSAVIGTTGKTKVTRDFPHPGWKKLKARGEIVMGPFDLSTAERQLMSPGACTDRNAAGTYYNNVSGDFMVAVEAATPVSYPLTADLERMAEIALMKAYERMNSPVILGGEILATLDQTISMLRRPFGNSWKLLGKIQKSYAKRVRKTTASEARAIGGAWLEYRYGWQPIMLDAKSMFEEAFQYRDNFEKLRLVARGEENQTRIVQSVTSHVPLSGSLAGWKASCTAVTSQNVRACTGIVYTRESMDASNAVLRTLGLRVQDFPATLWELMPWSFVADWFVNVGSWLRVVSPIPGLNILGSWSTIIDERTTTYSGNVYIPPYAGQPAEQVGSAGSSRKSSFSLVRTINPAVATSPLLTAKTLSALRSTDAMALSIKPILGLINRFKH